MANILDFRPDLQLATSTAVVLSARFPFVTPPGAIVENVGIARSSGLYQKTKVLELTDGAFYDNSGSIVARDIILALDRLLAKDERFKDFKDNVRFHLIRFTDTPAKRQGGASESGHFEFVTPLVAYDAVRQSRGVLLSRPPQGTGISNIYLLDEWYGGTLNWLLSRDTKLAVKSAVAGYGASRTRCVARSVTPSRADEEDSVGPRREGEAGAERPQDQDIRAKLRPVSQDHCARRSGRGTGRGAGAGRRGHRTRAAASRVRPSSVSSPLARPAAHPRARPHRRRRGSFKTASGRS